ncbi:cation:proton antiporter [Actinoplanes sp. NBRC 101535]|uniref:cation:proton antiporter n=1 Tax=Actinoplanes sp. NBRC 101535 TaxID=3032196 RepID=UPI00255523A4|nr:cation:proton antiporter [Actinoplanes sp. NBRC 101535]
MHAETPLPPLGGTALTLLLLQIAVLLGLALLLGRLATRLGLPAIVGELTAGVIAGPSLFFWLAPGAAGWLFPQQPGQAHLLDAVGQFGVVLFVGITGMQLDMALVRRRAATAAGVSLPGLLIPLGLGIGAGLLLPAALITEGTDRTIFALFLGVAMCVSAIPVIAKTLMDMNLLHRNIGQLILMSGTIDDVLGWLGLSLVTAMATVGLTGAGVTRAVLSLLLFITFAALPGRLAVRFLLRRTLRSESAGVTVSAAVVIILLFSAVTNLLGLEAIFGALVAGMLVASAGTEVLTRMASLRAVVTAVLAPIFFAVAGLRMNLAALADPQVLLAGVILLAIAIVGKFAGAFVGARFSRLNRWESLALGAGMNARGVVEVVVAMVGVRLGILSTAMYTVIVLIAIVTSLMGPPILRAAMARVDVDADEVLRREKDERLNAVR